VGSQACFIERKSTFIQIKPDSSVIALHLIAAPVFYVMDTIVGMPLWWRVMDFGSFLAGGGFLLAFWLWPSKPSPNTASRKQSD
jgi:hypothetical protein